MTAVDGLGLVVVAGLTAYAVLGGADFGAGVWDLLAAGRRRQAQRDLLTTAMGPVWEANHVWLIFVVITLFSGFPAAFAALSTALIGPLSLALLGIVLRGAAFVFRQYGAPDGGRPVRGTVVWGRVFAAASVVTPFSLGAAAGALSTGSALAGPPAAAAAAVGPAGQVAAVGVDGGVWRPFVEPVPLLAGGLAVACCAYLAAVYLARDAERVGDAALMADFRRRAIAAALAAGGLALGLLPVLPPVMADRLATVGAPAVGLSVVAGTTALGLLWRRRHVVARVAAALAVAALLWGWIGALHPWVVPGRLTIADAAAPTVIATPVLVVLLTGLAVVAPCYVFMLRTLRPLGGDHGPEVRTSPREATTNR
jgi:cytochrome bd ubiquinol oxidase subunit II